MNVTLRVQVGIRGAPQTIGPIWLDSSSIGNVSSWAGSLHILSMSRHYEDYVVTPRTIQLPVIPGFPLAHPYQCLTGKMRAAGVTGNIGEAIAAIFARCCLGLAIADIAHLRPRRPFMRRQAPDYLMRLRSRMPGIFAP